MSHLDEGTLHALLDGELDLAEVSEIQTHLGTCVACGSRLQEVKQILAEADRLVGTVEVPAGAPAPERPVSRPSPAPLRQPRDPGIWDQAPVLLVPDPIDPTARRRRWIRGLSAAAVIAVLVGGGKFLSNALKPGHPVLPERDLASAPPPAAPPVASPLETRTPTANTPARDKARQAPARPQPGPAVAKAAPTTVDRTADTSSGLADSAAPSATDSVSADSQLLATTGTASDTSAGTAAGAQESVPTERKTTDSAAGSRADRSPSTSQADRDQQLATRQAAAAALAELDRQRRRERANAATASLPPARPAPAVAESEPAPRAPTLEDRAQIYLRIGLDEAGRQLGGPVHVIEGMTPQFIGLVRGQQVPGADARRPVVRVVYLDPRGRMILLDQQRLDPSQAPAASSGNLRWVIGDVMLYLRGEPSPDVLRSLQARVR
jgi:hypothetical protein